MTQPQVPATEERANPSGGSAAAGGMNLHARVAAVAAVFLLGHRALGWLKELAADIPVDIWCETNGPGDDLRFVLENQEVVEAQAKKGLRRGDDLWTALESLARGIAEGSIAYGVLVVDHGASAIIRQGLARGIRRLGEGRTDSLDDITSEFKGRLESAGLQVEPVCRRLRVIVMHCSDHDDVSEQMAKSELLRLCATERDADTAWTQIQLSAHGLIERRGRWTATGLLGILKAAHVELRPTPESGPPIAICGGVWAHLDEISPERGYIHSFRQHYLVSDQMAAQPFGGRDEQILQLDKWLSDASKPSRLLICAPTARGKSALLVQWTECLESDATWAVVFVPISLRFGTNRPAVFYALLATQLARLLGANLTPPPSDLDTYYQGVSASLLNQAVRESRHVLVVLDGLDEAQGDGFSPTIFPPSLPPNIKILVSAREQAGDRGPEGWLRRLDWQGSTRAISETLPILDRAAIAPILESVGIEKEAVSDVLIDRLMVLSGGEPLLLALYAEDLSNLVKSGRPLGIEILEGCSPGFSAYFSRAFNSHSFAKDHGNQEAVDTTLSVLAMALGPLEGQHLTDLVCRLTSLPRPSALNRFVKPLERFIAGDGRADHGYVLNHPKLGEYLREERFDATTRKTVEHAFIEWGRGVTIGLRENPNRPVPAYVLHNHVNHLRQAGTAALDDIENLLTDGWRQAWFREEKDYAGYASSLLAASAMMLPCTSYRDEASRALRLKIKIALLVGSVKSQGITIPVELLAMALQEEVITQRQALNVVNLQQPENRIDFLQALASQLPDSDLNQLLFDVRHISDLRARNERLARLAKSLRAPYREEVIDDVLSWSSKEGDSLTQIMYIALLAPAFDDAQLETALIDVMSKAVPAQHAISIVMALAPVFDVLRERNKPELAERLIDLCLRWIDTSSDVLLAAQALEALAPRVAADRLEAQVARLSPLVRAVQEAILAAPAEPWHPLPEFRQQRVTRASTTLAILKIHQQPLEVYKTSVMAILSPLLTPDFWSLDTLVNVVPVIRADVRQEIVELARQIALNLPTANNRTHALTILARATTEPFRKSIVEQAFFNARHIEDDNARGQALVSLFSTLPAADKERDIKAVMADVLRVSYVLHRGDLQLELSDQLPSAAELADLGFQMIQMAADTANGTSIVLRNLAKFSQHRREAVFRWCWQQILARPNDFISGFQLNMAAEHGAEFWTTTELEIARDRLSQLDPHIRPRVYSGLLPVAKRLGALDFIDEAISEIAKQTDPNEGVLAMIRAIDFLPLDDPRRNMLSQHWFRALDSDSPHMGALVDGLKLLPHEDQAIAWQRLIARVKATAGASQWLMRLSLATSNAAERLELFEAALAACSAETAEIRMQQAAQIVAICEAADARWKALDLMTATPDVSRSAALSAIRQVAPAIAELGTDSLTHALMDDVRQCATWWP